MPVLFVLLVFEDPVFAAAFFGGEPPAGDVVDCGRASEATKIANKKSQRPFFILKHKKKGATYCPLLHCTLLKVRSLLVAGRYRARGEE